MQWFRRVGPNGGATASSLGGPVVGEVLPQVAAVAVALAALLTL